MIPSDVSAARDTDPQEDRRRTPSEFSSSEEGSPSVSFFKALRMDELHIYAHSHPRLNACTDACLADAQRIPDGARTSTHARMSTTRASDTSNACIPGYARMFSSVCKSMRIHQARLLPCWAHVSQATDAHICYLQQGSIICNHLQIMNI